MNDYKQKNNDFSMIDEVVKESAKQYSYGAKFRHHSFQVDELDFGASCYVVVDYDQQVTTLNYDYWTENSMQYPAIPLDEKGKDKAYKSTSLSSLLKQAIESGEFEEAKVLAEAAYKGIIYAYSTACCDKEIAFEALTELKDICDNTVYKIPFEFYEEGDYIERTNNIDLSRLMSKNSAIADAMIAGDLDLIRFLVEECGVELNRAEGLSGKMRSPMDIVAENDGYIKKEIVDYLVEKGAKPTVYSLRRAVKWGNAELVGMFVKMGVNVNRVIDGETALDVCLRIAKGKSSVYGTLGIVKMMNEGIPFAKRELEVCRNVDEILSILIEAGAKTAEEVKSSKIPVVRRVATLKKKIKVKLARKKHSAKEPSKAEEKTL